MDVYEIARKVHDRINGGDESKFPKTFLAVSGTLYVCEPINYFGWCTRSIARGDDDECIIKFCDSHDDESPEGLTKIHKSFDESRQSIIEFKSLVVKGLCVSTFLLGATVVGCYHMVFSLKKFIMG